jgi:hypothetical protein
MASLLASPSSAQTSLYNNHGPIGAAGTTPATRLPLVPWTDLAFRRHLGKGAFGDVALMAWARRGLTVAVKCNGTTCADGDAIDNERRLYELLKDNPHENIVPVYAICTDAPDGKVRLVMRFCEKGSLDSYLVGTARHEVGGEL